MYIHHVQCIKVIKYSPFELLYNVHVTTYRYVADIDLSCWLIFTLPVVSAEGMYIVPFMPVI